MNLASALLKLITVVLRWFLNPRAVAGRKDEKAHDNIQSAREALAENDGPAFDAHAAAQHDRVRQILRDHRRPGDSVREEEHP